MSSSSDNSNCSRSSTICAAVQLPRRRFVCGHVCGPAMFSASTLCLYVYIEC
jgi:hypothetical protein